MRFVFPLACLVLLLLACTTQEHHTAFATPDTAPRPPIQQATEKVATPERAGVACGTDHCGRGRVCCHASIEAQLDARSSGTTLPNDGMRCEDNSQRCDRSQHLQSPAVTLEFDECDDNSDCVRGGICCSLRIGSTLTHACASALACRECPGNIGRDCYLSKVASQDPWNL